MKTIKLTLTEKQARLLEEIVSNRMIGLYDGATDEERAELDKEYKALEVVWHKIIKG
jgi:hypothetical protein